LHDEAMTDHEETAKRLLPCYHPDGFPPCDDDSHNGDCPASFRPAVAAALAERDTYKRIAERNHKANLMPCPNCGHVQGTIHAVNLEAERDTEIVQLRAEVERLKTMSK